MHLRPYLPFLRDYKRENIDYIRISHDLVDRYKNYSKKASHLPNKWIKIYGKDPP